MKRKEQNLWSINGLYFYSLSVFFRTAVTQNCLLHLHLAPDNKWTAWVALTRYKDVLRQINSYKFWLYLVFFFCLSHQLFLSIQVVLLCLFVKTERILVSNVAKCCWQDMVVRIPFDIENGSNAASGVDYGDTPRAMKPRRGRPTVRIVIFVTIYVYNNSI